jgi:hypothetical protein
MTGSQRIGHDNLRVRDGAFVETVARDLAWPKAYLNGKSQLERNLARVAQMIGAV